MASDMAEFLRNKIKKALTHELQPELISRLNEIAETVENKDPTPTLVCLLKDLNDAISECRIFRQQMKSLNKNWIRYNFFRKLIFVHKMKTSLEKIKIRLENLPTAVGDGGEPNPNSRSTTFDSDKGSEVIGFNIDNAKEFEEIREKLLKNNGGLKVMGIYGICGSGKTTLALEIFDSEKVRTEFSKRIYVCLSDIYQSSVGKIGDEVKKLILEALDSDTGSIDYTFDDLPNILASGKYLIVVDDVRDFHKFWDDFLKALPEKPGGAVIFTCRRREMARKIVGAENLFEIPQLHKQDCWKIFENNVHAETHTEIEGARPTLAVLKEDIWDQFHGLPLAAKSLAMTVPSKIQEIFG